MSVLKYVAFIFKTSLSNFRQLSQTIFSKKKKMEKIFWRVLFQKVHNSPINLLIKKKLK